MNTAMMYNQTLNSVIFPRREVSPRLLNRKLNIIHHAVRVVEKQSGHATSKAVADYLGISVDDYNYILQDANSYRLLNSKQEVA